MTTVTVRYTEHDGYWVARCDELPELIAGDAHLADVMSLAHTAIEDLLGVGELTINDLIESASLSSE